MRLGEMVVTDEVRIVADHLAGGRLDLYAGERLIVSIPFASEPAAVVGGEAVFTKFEPTVATDSGTADAFRAMSSAGIVFEGTMGPEGELHLEPSDTIEAGDVVRVYTLTYVQPR